MLKLADQVWLNRYTVESVGVCNLEAFAELIRAAALSTERLARGGEPVAKVSESKPVLYSDEYTTPPPQAERVPLSDEQCEWTIQDDDYGDTWQSSCGELWSFIDGGPKENRVSFCHHCGKKVGIGTPKEST